MLECKTHNVYHIIMTQTKENAMKLYEYLRDNNIQVSKFAEMLDIRQTSLSKIIHNKMKVSKSTAKKIEELTEGKVTRIEMLYPDDTEIHVPEKLEETIKKIIKDELENVIYAIKSAVNTIKTREEKDAKRTMISSTAIKSITNKI